MLSASLYVYADKFTACVQNVRLPNACMHRNNNNNNNNNKHDNVYGAVIMAEPLREFTRFI